MDINKAIKILEQHNKWRRDNNVPSKHEPVSPTDLGIAIDVIVFNYKTKER